MRIAAFSFGEFWAGYAVYDDNEMVDCGEMTLSLDPHYLSKVLRVHELIRMLIKAYRPEIIVTDEMGLYEDKEIDVFDAPVSHCKGIKVPFFSRNVK